MSNTNSNFKIKTKQEEDYKQSYPTCEKCGWENKNFPGQNKQIICTPCQIIDEHDSDMEQHHGC